MQTDRKKMREKEQQIEEALFLRLCQYEETAFITLPLNKKKNPIRYKLTLNIQ